jgi:hypothetical protein
MVIGGTLGLAVLLAPSLGQKPKQTAEGWQFPVKLTCQLIYWLGFACGIAAVVFDARTLLASGVTHWGGWAGFAFGITLVLLVLSDWPQPLVFDKTGVGERGSPTNRIRWDELRQVHEYRIRSDRFVVFHGSPGKRIVVANMAYDATSIIDHLLENHAVAFHSLTEEEAPASILKAPVQPE